MTLPPKAKLQACIALPIHPGPPTLSLLQDDDTLRSTDKQRSGQRGGILGARFLVTQDENSRAGLPLPGGQRLRVPSFGVERYRRLEEQGGS